MQIFNEQNLTRAVSLISIFAFIGALFLMGVAFYWEFFPENIISYPHGNHFAVLTKKVKAGSYMKYQLNYCKYTEDISTVYQTLVGHNVYTLAPIQRNLPVGCQSRTISDIFIPPTVPPGTYTLQITVVYHPNPIRTVEYFVDTDPFEITN